MSDAIPEFQKPKGAEGDVSLTNLSAFSSGVGATSTREVAIIVAVAVIIVGGVELALRVFEVPHYILPPPSEIVRALFSDFTLIAPHLGYTLIELFSGFSLAPSSAW